MRPSTPAQCSRRLADIRGRVTGCGGSDKAGGESKADATVLTLANGNDDSHSLEPFARRSTPQWRDAAGSSSRAAGVKGRPTSRTASSATWPPSKADLGWAGSRAFDDVDVPRSTRCTRHC